MVEPDTLCSFRVAVQRDEPALVLVDRPIRQDEVEHLALVFQGSLHALYALIWPGVLKNPPSEPSWLTGTSPVVPSTPTR